MVVILGLHVGELNDPTSGAASWLTFKFFVRYVSELDHYDDRFGEELVDVCDLDANHMLCSSIVRGPEASWSLPFATAVWTACLPREGVVADTGNSFDLIF